MKCVILCFLAICAFQAVFAGDAGKMKQDVAKLHKKSCDQINNRVNQIQAIIAAECKAARQKGTNIGSDDDGCLGSAEISVKTCVDQRIAQLDECRDKAAKTKDIKSANKCCSEIVAIFEKEAKEAVATVKKCILNCVHHDCSENE